MKKADIGVALYILAAVIFLIVPINSTLLDVMLALNISLALIVLFNTLFVKEVLDMSFFPTLLLFTTIFRIALNVSSTRLILTTGQPGNVVETFGNFVGGGDMIVGAVVFIILIIIQFVVINKGSERVAEVSARFTLDAMPGKQMAIDADLNTGAITDAQARERRNKIQEEAGILWFYGRCDQVCQGRCGGRSYHHACQFNRRYRDGNDARRYGVWRGDPALRSFDDG